MQLDRYNYLPVLKAVRMSADSLLTCRIVAFDPPHRSLSKNSRNLQRLKYLLVSFESGLSIIRRFLLLIVHNTSFKSVIIILPSTPSNCTCAFSSRTLSWLEMKRLARSKTYSACHQAQLTYFSRKHVQVIHLVGHNIVKFD